MKQVFCYTDGSAVVKGKNKGKGGFGTYFPDLYGKKKAYSLGFIQTKTGRMELNALLFALRAIPKSNCTIKLSVYSDSEYVVKSFTEKRLERWIQAGWVNTSGIVANKDIWKKILFELNERRSLVLDMNHIRSHQVEKEKNPKEKIRLLQDPHIRGNMIADMLAGYKRHINLLQSDKL